MKISTPTPAHVFIFNLLMRVRPAPITVFLKRILGVRRIRIKTTEGGFLIDPVSQFGITLLRAGIYEPSMIQVLERLLKPSSIFVDIGANEGYFSVIASKIVGPTGSVVAVEPQQRLETILVENFKINCIQNITLVQSAISDCVGNAALHVSPSTNTGSTSLIQTTKYKLPIETIQTVTLGDLFTQHNIKVVDLMKMDIEGYEYEAILGSPEIFRDKRIRSIALELHPLHLRQRGLDTNEITKFLQDCGYVIDKRFSTLVLTAS